MSNVSAFTDPLNEGLDDIAATLATITGLPIVRDPRNIIPNCVLLQAPSLTPFNKHVIDVTYPATVIGSGPGNLDSLRILLNNVHKVVDKNIGVISGRPVSIDVGGTVAPAYELEIRIKVASA